MPKYNPEHIMPGPYEFVPDEFAAADVARLWPTAASELAGYAKHLAATRMTITAAHVRMAVHLAERAFRAMTPHARPPIKSMVDIATSAEYVSLWVGGLNFRITSNDARWYAERLVEAADAADRTERGRDAAAKRKEKTRYEH